MLKFTIFPAIDLRQGRVVRLQEGDPARETGYASDPAEVAARWLDAGADWLHVINLDGALDQPDSASRQALQSILEVTRRHGASIQFGGGLRSLALVEQVLDMGVDRAIFGTLAIEQPDELQKAISLWGTERIAASLDARQGMVKVRGWKEGTITSAMSQAQELRKTGLNWLIYTDISRDGMQTGLNLNATVEIAQSTGINVIAAGGLKDWKDIENACQAGLSGVITGRALYEGAFDSGELFSYRCKGRLG
jgi:phosphoribosylformimino-5-aminoimidazole carboxamide ribotide isomerase